MLEVRFDMGAITNQKTRKNGRLSRFACILFSAVLCLTILGGCAGNGIDVTATKGKKQADYEVKEVRCVYNLGDQDGAELDVFRSDGTLTCYTISPYSDSGVDFFTCEIPPDDKCNIKESKLEDDEWDNIVNAVKDNKFVDLPEELPEVGAQDGSTCYIEVETSEGSFRSGGYCAGNGSGKKHKRFYGVKSVLMEITRK